MQSSRRELLHTAGLAAVAVGLAGCNSDSSTGNNSTSSTTDGPETTATNGDADGSESVSVSADAAVAAEWNTMRARLDDAYALALAGNPAVGASVGQQVFQRFEGANGEYGAHEMLESTSEDNYEGFESALETLVEELQAGEVEAAEAAWRDAGDNLRAAQLAVVGEQPTYALDLLRLGATANNVEVLAAAGHGEGAVTLADELATWFEDAAVHSVVESADSDAYESFESALETAGSAAGSGDVQTVRTATDDALSAAVSGAYAIVSAEELAGAGHLAAMGAQGFDAAVLSSLGGPSTDFAHASVLTTYRARVHDAGWLAAQGSTERARTVVQDVFGHFEADRRGYHEALEDADAEAYEGFESGLDSLTTAIQNGNEQGIDEAVATVDDNLVTGIEALAGETGAALLEAAFFRASIADADELYRLGNGSAAAGVAESLFQTFEQDEAGFHEALESASEELYHTFEEEHLVALPDAFRAGDDEAVETHVTGAMDALLSFETTAGTTAQVSAVESAYMAASGFDAAAVATLGAGGRAGTIVQSAFQHFEAGAGGFHEALEDADHETYETFETDLGAIREAANGDGDVYGAAKTFGEDAVDAAYAVVGAAGGANTGAAATVMEDTFGAFENAEVHELLEEADHDAYESFESELEGYIGALQDGSGVSGAATAFADATIRAQFAVVGAVDDAPVDDSGSGGGESQSDTQLKGGPNVVEGVPSDADHVVEMKAVSFAPSELTVSAGDTVAFEYVGGEPHSITAYEGEIPEEADYWASGGFDSESAATTGWDEGKGAVQSGESYVHTFETAGEHGYYCIPHEMAGMTGTIVVEE